MKRYKKIAVATFAAVLVTMITVTSYACYMGGQAGSQNAYPSQYGQWSWGPWSGGSWSRGCGCGRMWGEGWGGCWGCDYPHNQT